MKINRNLSDYIYLNTYKIYWNKCKFPLLFDKYILLIFYNDIIYINIYCCKKKIAKQIYMHKSIYIEKFNLS